MGATVEVLAGPLIRIIEATGPRGAIVAAVIVGLGLVVIIYARTKGLFAASLTQDQQAEFQDRLIAQVDRLMEREEAIQREADRLEADNARLRERMGELQTSVALMRNQLRRAIDLLRAVREGRLPPGAIEAADTIGDLP